MNILCAVAEAIGRRPAAEGEWKGRPAGVGKGQAKDRAQSGAFSAPAVADRRMGLGRSFSALVHAARECSAVIPVRVINLKESHERRGHMKRELAAAGIPFTFMEAIGKDEVNPSPTLTRNQIACALSHLLAIHRIAEGEDEWGAVFEDDVFVSAEARQFLELETLRALPRFDILQLFGSTTKAALTVSPTSIFFRRFWRRQSIWSSERIEIAGVAAVILLKS